jgi:uncharacterized protein (DUF427 family)
MKRREPVGPGQESVWDYPRPPRLEATNKHITIRFGGKTIVDTTRAYRVLETSHPPAYYVPREDVAEDALRPAQGQSFCEWKGRAAYFDIVVGDKVAEGAAWTYPEASGVFAPIKGYLSFYPRPMDQCTVDGDVVTPQPGGFYGGWITKDIVGPFKGSPGTMGW